MKYVMFEDPVSGEIPFLFPDSFNHIKMVQIMNSKYPGIKHISAGFVKFEDGKFSHCYGYSSSLNENNIPRKIDDKIIKVYLKI